MPSDVFRASSCTKHIIYVIDGYEIVLGPFHRVAVILEFVASSDDWCETNAFGAAGVLGARP
jgi:hypothetical protein